MAGCRAWCFGLGVMVALASSLVIADEPGAEGWRSMPIVSEVDSVAPMAGLVVWNTHAEAATLPIQLEFSYLLYNDVVDAEGAYDWSVMDDLLAEVAGRGHQAVVRFRFIHPGFDETAVPDFIKQLPDYREVIADSEGHPTAFCDWSHPALQRFALEFHTKFAERYDDDPRLAFVQTGFGLWAEYHIYDGPMELGKTFPSKEFQARFLKHLDAVYEQTPWSISIDAAAEVRTPFAERRELLGLGFGLFDDSFMHAQHDGYNTNCWNFFGRDRWRAQPMGGEFSYYTQADQENALGPDGMHGEPFADAAARFHLTYMFANDQPRYREPAVLMAAGMAIGYRFELVSLETDGASTRGRITNAGIAPLYHDAWPAMGEVRSEATLKGLLPGASLDFVIDASGEGEAFSIASDRLVPGQVIPFDAAVE